MVTPTPLSEFHARLSQHNWHFDDTEDHSVYRAGADERRELIEISRQTPAHTDLMNQWCAHVFEGAPKPVDPGVFANQVAA